MALQNAQQRLSRDAGYYVASAADRLPAIAHVDGVPDDELLCYLLVRLVIGSLERGQCAVRKHHAPPVSHACRVALDYQDVERRVGFLNKQPSVKPSGPSAQDHDFGFWISGIGPGFH